jgi:hypothetical protein
MVVGWFAAPAGADEVHPVITYKCTPAPEDCTGWYRSAVHIDWTVTEGTPQTGCQDKTYTRDTPGAREFCRAIDLADGAITTVDPFQIKVDMTPPAVTGVPDRPANANGWYNQPVSVAFRGSDATSGVASCTAPTTYRGPDSGAARLAGTCTDRAGNVGSVGYGLKYDTTPPVVANPMPGRPADHAGWYTAPVPFAAGASDATSGPAVCPPVTYGGPDSAAAAVAVVCSDQAGNTASRAFPLSFDATPPGLTELEADVGDRRVALRWAATADTRSVEILRTPGKGGDPATVVFQGPGVSFVDTKVVNRRRYRYEVRAVDAAGNMSTRRVSAIARPRLLAPARGAVIKAGSRLLMRWTPVRGARYFNVQLFRDGRKVFSGWPTKTRVRLPRRWNYRGRRQHLRPGEYQLHVWPGRGARSKGDYGTRIGKTRFTVVP